MKWKDILSEKVNRVLLMISVVMILALMIMIRFAYKNHLSDLRKSVTSIYEDRLVAKNYLSEISRKIAVKKVSLESEEQFIERIVPLNDSINQLIEKYENTELTDDEADLLVKLKDNIRMSDQYEDKFLSDLTQPQRDIISNGLTKQYNSVISDLEQLSKIQLEEGKKLLDNSYEILDSSNSSSKLEIALIIVLMLVIILNNFYYQKTS